VALVVTAAFLTSAAARMTGASASSAPGGSDTREIDSLSGYFVDTLFRSDMARPDQPTASTRGEVGRLLAQSLRQGEMPAADKSYLVQLVATNTGLSRTDAEARVNDVVGKAQQAADTARKMIAHALLWGFLALLIGAFCASLAATIGGRQRDHVVLV
jgi:hypothetical protein